MRKIYYRKLLIFTNNITPPPHHIKISRVLTDFGWLKYLMGDPESSRTLLQNALLNIENHHAANELEKAVLYHKLVLVEESQKHFEKALEYLKKSYYLFDRFDKEELLNILSHMYSPFYNLDADYSKEVLLYVKKALSMTEKLLGTNHRFSARYNLALAHLYEKK